MKKLSLLFLVYLVSSLAHSANCRASGGQTQEHGRTRRTRQASSGVEQLRVSSNTLDSRVHNIETTADQTREAQWNPRGVELAKDEAQRRPKLAPIRQPTKYPADFSQLVVLTTSPSATTTIAPIGQTDKSASTNKSRPPQAATHFTVDRSFSDKKAATNNNLDHWSTGPRRSSQQLPSGPSGQPMSPAERAGGHLRASNGNLNNEATECRWLSLAEFGLLSVEHEELVARDSLGLPMYLISMRAYLNSHQLDFIPLRNFRPPRSSSAYRWWLKQVPSAATSGVHLPLAQLNCSIPNGPMSSSTLASVQLTGSPAMKPAEQQLLEQVTIQVDCGYLVLDLLSSLSSGVQQVQLNSVSFYQNWGGNMSTLGSPLEWHQHMVFSTNSSSALIKMPLFSRYTCQQRIELIDRARSSVKLVLDEFELQRLSPLASQSEPASESELGAGLGEQPLQDNNNNNHNNNNHHIDEANSDDLRRRQKELEEEAENLDLSFGRLRRGLGIAARNREPTGNVILYKNPIVGVTRCPRSPNELAPLNVLMDLQQVPGQVRVDEGLELRFDRPLRANSQRQSSFPDQTAGEPPLFGSTFRLQLLTLLVCLLSFLFTSNNIVATINVQPPGQHH